jgi:hypothetical protein
MGFFDSRCAYGTSRAGSTHVMVQALYNKVLAWCCSELNLQLTMLLPCCCRAFAVAGSERLLQVRLYVTSMITACEAAGADCLVFMQYYVVHFALGPHTAEVTPVGS